jgi:hypothetical protein
MSDTSLGLAGGLGGQEFTGYSLPPGARIKEIHLFAGQVIEAIQLVYTGAEGVTEWLPRIGGPGGNEVVFTLDDDEYVTGISGRAGWYVDSLRFHTNKRTSEIVGGEGGDQEYAYMAPEGSEVAGLFGRAEGYLDAIGILTRGRPQAEAKPRAKSKAKAAPTVEIAAKTSADPKAKTAPKTEAAPKAKTKATPAVEVAAKTSTAPKTKAAPKTKTQATPAVEIAADIKTGSKPKGAARTKKAPQTSAKKSGKKGKTDTSGA